MSFPFKSVLIANRGEIACRIIRTCKRLGLTTVAVYSEADAGALHCSLADRAAPIGPARAQQSYLSIDALMEAAWDAGADAVHPGYGFLSEDPRLAEACEAAGLIFIGPPSAAMRAMARKDAAKILARNLGVPVLEGQAPDDQGDAALAQIADAVGYPILVKAVAGGGGRGMRRVDDPAFLRQNLAAARREAAASFGDDRLLIERFLQTARHVEIQVLADAHGGGVHLFERDCSLQRRHQKIIEEAPAPGVDATLRAAMGEAALKLCRAVGYRGAGTVEFILDASGPLRPDGFWFMEMNTRLQVEHPVTEAITGLDLVEQQLRIAAGEPLGFGQEAIKLDGHAVEARVCAEDPRRNYLPSPGKLRTFDLPSVQVRIETGLRTGDEVTPWYDNLLAKVIAHGPDRATALAALEGALALARIEGVSTNLDLLRDVMGHAAFRAGDVRTDFLDLHRAELLGTAGHAT